MVIRPIKIFYCYAHEDDTLRKQLAAQLSPLRRLRVITGWFDHDIQAGTEWERESKEQMDAANIILLLISANFMASDYCYTIEMMRALERHKAGTAYVIPILLRPVEWEMTPLGVLSPLPIDKVPVTQWANPDAAWLNIFQGIREIVSKLHPMQFLSLQDRDILYTEQGPLSGKTIGEKYLLGELIGEGGFSQVYKAQHLLIQRQQAIKVLLEHHFRKQEFRNRFLREAQIVASLEHPHIIHLDDFWVEAAQAYLVMPFISGGTLQDILEKQQGFLEHDQIVSYLEDICAALDYSHERGVVHLDLKPQNLLVHENGRLLLSDFGLAHLMKQGGIEGGSSLRVGTPHYMAPEHIKGSPERQSDLFSLGIILYQMLVGRLPFDGHSPETVMMKNMSEWPPALRSLRPELPPSVENMLKRALAKQPEQRYQTANEFLIALKNALVPSPQAIVLRPTPAPLVTPVPVQNASVVEQMPPDPIQKSSAETTAGVEDLLSQMAGGPEESLKQVAESVLASTASLPENVRLQVLRSMQDIQNYINHGLLTSATEECRCVIDIAPQYLDVHQVLCEIYVRQGKIEQAITKYVFLVDAYVVNGRTDDAITIYRRILQLEPNNLTYRMRLINLLSNQGNKEDLLRERNLVAESYLRLGYMDRALTELEQALQESPTSVSTRLNYALALQKLGWTQQAAAEYQRVLQVDPRSITALVRWHIAMITSIGSARTTTLELLSRIRWQLRGEGQKHADAVIREYLQSADIYPNNAEVHFALGQIYHQSGQFDKAIDSYILAMRDSAVEVLARVSAAQSLLTQGKPETAIQQLEQALQSVHRSPTLIDPAIWAARPREEGEQHQAPDVEISLLLVKAYGRTGRQEQMEAILRQVKQARPAQGDVESALQEYDELVRHYRNNRQTDNALSVLSEMVRLAPQDPRAHDELADIYINHALLDEGVAELRLLADIYLRRNELEKAAAAIQRIGSIYAEMGNNDEALSNLRRAAELDPESMDLMREVVSFCLQLARQIEPRDEEGADRYQSIAAQYQLIVARHYFETQQVKKSVAALQQLITIDRSNFDAYDMLGQTYQSVGEYEQASRVYRYLGRINPGSSIARERLAALQERRMR